MILICYFHWERWRYCNLKIHCQREDHRNFNIIYESLLLEGRTGNLTDLALVMVLGEKPLAWLQVMHERLKHLIISSEKFKEKKIAEYNAPARAKQISKGKGIGKHSKGIRFLGIGGKGKGKKLSRNDNQMKITPCNTSRSNQISGSTIGNYNELLCFVWFSECVDFCVSLLFHCVGWLFISSLSVGMEVTK